MHGYMWLATHIHNTIKAYLFPTLVDAVKCRLHPVYAVLHGVTGDEVRHIIRGLYARCQYRLSNALTCTLRTYCTCTSGTGTVLQYYRY